MDGQEKRWLMLVIVVASVVLIGGSWNEENNLTGASVVDKVTDFDYQQLFSGYYLYAFGFIVFLILLILVFKLPLWIKLKIKKHKMGKKLNPNITKNFEGGEETDLQDEYAAVNRKLDGLKQERLIQQGQSKVKQMVNHPRLNLKEIMFERKLRKITARLNNYKNKPLILNPSNENLELNKELQVVENELTNVDQIIPRKQRIITKMGEIPEARSEILKRELGKTERLLQKSSTHPEILTANIFSKKTRMSKKRKREERAALREVKRISKKIEGKRSLPENELLTIEKKIRKLKKK